MFYQKFSKIIESYNFDNSLVSKLDKYLAYMSPEKAKRILPSLAANELNVKYNDLMELFVIAANEGIVSYNFEAICPKTGCLINNIEFNPEQNEYIVECFRCYCDSHTINKDQLKISFKLNNVQFKKKTSKEIEKQRAFIQRMYDKR